MFHKQIHLADEVKDTHLLCFDDITTASLVWKKQAGRKAHSKSALATHSPLQLTQKKDNRCLITLKLEYENAQYK